MSSASQITVSLLFLFLSLCGNCATLAEDVVYQNPPDIQIRGVWFDSDDGYFRVFPNEYDFDMNHDGVSDIRFRHSHMPRSRRIDSEAVELLRIAEGALSESLELVRGLRVLSIQAANEAVNDEDQLSQFQAQVDNSIDTLDRISRFQLDNRGVLDGSRGVGAVSPASPSVLEVVSATSNTVPGSYTLDVTTAAERAFAEAAVAQTSPLAADETLVLNGVSIDLFKGMTQYQVVDRISDFASQFAIYADVSPNGHTRLYTKQFGSDQRIAVVASRPARSDSSGIGTRVINGVGLDIVADIGGNSYTGNGNTVKATTGNEQDVLLRVGPSAVDPTKSVDGALGTIDVVDHSPVFIVDSATGESESISLPNIEPSTLGNSVPGNQFSSLSEIRVYSAAQANDSLTVIDHSIEELERFQREVKEFLAVNAYPYGVATLRTLNGAQYATGHSALLPAGVQVGSDLDFEVGKLKLQDSNFFQSLRQSGFMGVRTPVRDGWRYGWVGVSVDEESSFTVSDYAWNSRPNFPVVTGVASALDRPVRLLGDTHGDGTIDFSDFLVLAKNFNEPATWEGGDFTGDGFVRFDDFLALAGNYEASSVVAKAVPEPTLDRWIGILSCCVIAVRVRSRQGTKRRRR